MQLDTSLFQEAERELGISPLEIHRFLVSLAAKTGEKKFIVPSMYLKEKYIHEPVSCTRWLRDPEYFGHVGNNVWPMVRSDFLRIMEANPRPLRVVLSGSIGWGKTFLSALCMNRILYELGCLRDPQGYYGLSPASHISFMNLSVSATHARRVFFATLRDMMDGSPWFRKYFPRSQDLKLALYWPQRFISFVPGSSSELAPLGENLFGGVIEEANFFPVVVGSKKIRNPAEREWDQAKKLHDAVWRRMKSRFQKKGRIPGMLILNSSAKYPDDFLDKIIAENDPYTMVISHSTWETKPASRFSGKTFYVFVGDAWSKPHQIRDDKELEVYKKKGKVVAVPIEYKSDFDRDLEGAIRDVVGLNVRSLHRFFTNDDAIKACVDSRIPVPFSTMYSGGIVSTELNLALRFRDLVDPRIPQDKPPRPALNPEARRFCHIDLGLSEDACGICVGHIAELKEVKRRRETDEKVEEIDEVAPVIVADLILRILPPLEGEIQIEDVRQLLYDLRRLCGFTFARITYDQYQSKDSMQILKRRFGDEIVGYLSVDRTDDQYNVLKEAIYEGRFKCYHYDPLFRELQQLVRDPKSGKVDHPPNGSKDVADGVAGMVWNATTYEVWQTSSDFSVRREEPRVSEDERIKAEFVDRLRGRQPQPKTDELDEETLLKELEEGLEEE